MLSGKGARRAREGHPWVYRDDLASCDAEAGDLVCVEDPRGIALGWAAFSSRSRIALRLLHRGVPGPDPVSLVRERLEAASRSREGVARRASAYRVVFSEADGLPGVIVDRYGPAVSVQTSTPFAERHREAIFDWIVERLSPEGVVERNDGAVRDLEGLPRRRGVVRGRLPAEVFAEEDGIRYPVDVLEGQKTGAFLDQRENRARFGALASGIVLDAFAYEGLFGVHALRGGAERVVAVESSKTAEARARRVYELNGVGERLSWIRENVFEFLRTAHEEGTLYDAVALDPPAFAKNRASVPAALRAYREIHRRAFAVVRPGGLVLTCSCSHAVGAEEFLGVVRAGAADAGREAWLLERRGQSEDHPVLLSLPESAYLKCAILRVF